MQLRQIQGEISAEQLKDQLLELRRTHARIEALTEGESEALRVMSFLTDLGDQMSIEDKISIFNALQKYDTIATLSQGNAQLYFTPAEVDLSIEARSPVS